MDPLRANGWAANHRGLETLSLREGGFKHRVVENGFFLKNRRAESAATNKETAELGVFMSLPQSDILTSRFAFQTHAPEEFRTGFVDLLLERCFSC